MCSCSTRNRLPSAFGQEVRKNARGPHENNMCRWEKKSCTYFDTHNLTAGDRRNIGQELVFDFLQLGDLNRKHSGRTQKQSYEVSGGNLYYVVSLVYKSATSDRSSMILFLCFVVGPTENENTRSLYCIVYGNGGQVFRSAQTWLTFL